jgi:hypothetical protein
MLSTLGYSLRLGQGRLSLEFLTKTNQDNEDKYFSRQSGGSDNRGENVNTGESSTIAAAIRTKIYRPSMQN